MNKARRFLILMASGGPSDTTRPTVAITSAAATITAAAFTATFTFSEDVSGFELGDITVANGTAGTFGTTSASVYTAVITPTATGTVTVDVAEGVAQDTAGNTNTAATQFSILYIAATVWLYAGAGAGTNDGDVVTTWTDQSGNANSPTQGTADNRPTYQTNEINGLPVVRGDGSNDFLKLAFTLNQPCTYFWVFKTLVEKTAGAVSDGGSINTAKFFEANDATDQFQLYAGNPVTVTHPAVAQFRIASANVNGASSRLTVGTAKTSGNAGASNPGGLTLFSAGSGGAATTLNCDIAEVIVFGSSLADATMNQIGAYLATKYGLTWSSLP
jgi:hypothetical protein